MTQPLLAMVKQKSAFTFSASLEPHVRVPEHALFMDHSSLLRCVRFSRWTANATFTADAALGSLIRTTRTFISGSSHGAARACLFHCAAAAAAAALPGQPHTDRTCAVCPLCLINTSRHVHTNTALSARVGAALSLRYRRRKGLTTCAMDDDSRLRALGGDALRDVRGWALNEARVSLISVASRHNIAEHVLRELGHHANARTGLPVASLAAPP